MSRAESPDRKQRLDLIISELGRVYADPTLDRPEKLAALNTLLDLYSRVEQEVWR